MIARVLLSGRFLRAAGAMSMYWSLAQAALLETWVDSFLFGAFVLGLGLGIGNCEFGGDE